MHSTWTTVKPSTRDTTQICRGLLAMFSRSCRPSRSKERITEGKLIFWASELYMYTLITGLLGRDWKGHTVIKWHGGLALCEDQLSEEYRRERCTYVEKGQTMGCSTQLEAYLVLAVCWQQQPSGPASRKPRGRWGSWPADSEWSSFWKVPASPPASWLWMLPPL